MPTALSGSPGSNLQKLQKANNETNLSSRQRYPTVCLSFHRSMPSPYAGWLHCGSLFRDSLTAACIRKRWSTWITNACPGSVGPKMEHFPISMQGKWNYNRNAFANGVQLEASLGIASRTGRLNVGSNHAKALSSICLFYSRSLKLHDFQSV